MTDLDFGVDDPRPDLPGDHGHWVDVLTRAAAQPGSEAGDSLYWALRGARAIGAELLEAPFRGGLRIRSRRDTEADYHAVRLHLLPHQAALTALLGGGA